MDDLISRSEVMSMLKEMAEEEKKHRRWREKATFEEARLRVAHMPGKDDINGEG